MTKDGKFSGWEELFVHLDNENDRNLAEKIAGKMPVYKKAERKSFFKVHSEQEKANEGIFLLENVNGETEGELIEVEFNMDEVSPTWKNLPPEYEKLMKTMSNEQQFTDPLGTLQYIAIIRAGGNDQLRQQMNDMPKQKEWNDIVNQMDLFSKTDPSQFYEPLHKIGSGGFAQVFKVKRIADGEIFALKLMEPKNEKDRNMMKNEVALMKLNDGDAIIKVVEAFIFKERYWIILEMMEGALTDILI